MCAEAREAYASAMFARCHVLVLCLATIVLAPALAQTAPMAGMNMADMKSVPRPSDLPPAKRITGIGNSHIQITASPEAQAWFDQGLSLLHDFWDYEAARAFEQGVRTDPKCAMCYWGLYKIEGFRSSETRAYGMEALKQASALKKHTSKAEKLYIGAAESESRSAKSPDPEVIAAYRKLVALHAKDVEARIFLAESLGDGYDDHGNPKGSTNEKIAILEGVLRDAPDDSAANHYWIHAMEPSNHPERALDAAAKLASLAPNSGHMVHMPGHIYYRCGKYAEAEHWFAASTAVDERYMNTEHVGPDDDWNYVHNLMYGIANLIEEGKLSEANALSDRLSKGRGQLSATLYIWSARDSMTRINDRLPVALRMGDWPAVLTLLDAQTIPEKDNTANLRFLATSLHRYAEGMAALDRDDLVVAQRTSDALDASLWRTHASMDHAATPPPDDKANAQPDPKKAAQAAVMPDGLSEPMVKSLSIASLELRAGILVQQKKLEAAKALYAEATHQEKELGYREPPFYIRPVGETEGAALARAGDFRAAEAAYKSALEERPLSGFGLYGLAHTEDLAGEKATADRDYAAFLKAWSHADATLPELTQARQALGRATPQTTASR
jgi:tetratricopeptide (TPR) repeat protein